ncbi:MAG: hypothetical protein OES38_22545 [Gammaproteobacteria bacterium]|nr:hypothetical protein [Gammaproteobacteria bacterium]
MKIILRIILATVASPLVVIPVVVAAMLLVQSVELAQGRDFTTAKTNFDDWFGVALTIGWIGVMFAGFANIIIGAPLYLVLRFLDVAEPLLCALIGCIVGLLLGDQFDEVGNWIIVLTGLSGAAVGAAFCRLANGPENRA